MTLDEAIQHCKEVAENTTCAGCKKEHLQLAEWLEELKKRRSDNMAKNLIPEIAKMLGVELGEEFKVKGDDELTYRFDSDGLKLTHDSGIELAKISANVAFVDLVNGKDEIIKLPWNPKKGERYYTFVPRSNDEKLIVTSTLWENDVADNALLKAGWVFKTEEEAQKALPIVAKKIGAKYELPNTKIVEPWKPKKGKIYWTFNVFFESDKWTVTSFVWGDEVFDNAVFKLGWIYRTKEEAETALPKVAAEMGVNYEL